jgi:hypothetical protein
MSKRFQFRLRTLMIAVTAWRVLLAQWPLFDWERPTTVVLGQTSILTGRRVYSKITLRDGHYFVPTLVVCNVLCSGSLQHCSQLERVKCLAAWVDVARPRGQSM